MHRVMFIGNFGPAHSTENHLRRAMESHGWTVEQAQENDPATWRRSDQGEFDFVLWTRTWHLPEFDQLGFLDRCRDLGVPTVAYHLDRWWGLEREHQVTDEPYFAVDLVITADGGHADEWASLFIEHVWFPPAVLGAEASIDGRLRPEYESPVAFVGSHHQYHGEWPYRMELVAWLGRQYRRVIRFWPQGPAIRGQDLNDLYASTKVVVGDSCLVAPSNNYWSDRVPETTGRGGFLIHPETPGLVEAHPHLVTYPVGDFVRLKELIDHYVRNDEERIEIARLNRAHTLEHHTYERRVAQLEALMTKLGFLRPIETRTGEVTVVDRGVVARFDLRADTTDGIVVGEVWRDRTYGLKPADVEGRTVVDIGANIGAFSIWAARAGAEAVVAYEPDPANAERLRLNRKLNETDGPLAVQLFEMAVNGSGGRARLIGESGGVQTVVDAEGPVEFSMIGHVVEYAATPTIGVLKLDCEGGEYDIICSMTSRDFAAVDRIVMEFHNAAGEAHDGVTHPRWTEMVERLARFGRVEIVGIPSRGGIIRWRRYDA